MSPKFQGRLKVLSKIKNIIGKAIIISDESSSIFRNMGILATGTAFSSLIGFASMPLITRIYTPEDFGVLSIFVSVLALIIPFVTLRYSVAIPLPNHGGTGTNLFILCLLIVFGLTILVAFVCWFLIGLILSSLSFTELAPYWWLLPVGFLGAGIYESLSAWATREKKFKALAKSKLSQSTSSAVVKILFGILGLKPIGLLIGHVVAQVGGSVSLFIRSKTGLSKSIRQVSIARLFFVARRYSDFPKYQIASRFLLILSVKSPLFFMAYMFGAKATGQLGLALTVAAMPMTLFGNTIGQAYFAEIARIGRKDKDKIKQISNELIQKISIAGILPFLLIVTTGPILFSLVFGEQWREAGAFTSILAIYLMSQFISLPFINILNVFEKQSLLLFLNATRIFLIVLVFFLSSLIKLDKFYTIGVYSIFLTFYYLFVIFKVYRVFNEQ